MKFNKMLLVFALSLLTAGLSYASDCPSNWPVAIKEFSGQDRIEMTVQPGLIKNQKLTGSLPLIISDHYTHLAEVRGQTLIGSFINQSNTTQWLPIGDIETSQKVSDGICHKLNLANGLSLEEKVKRYKVDCYPLPSWMCGKEKASYLEMQYPGFILESISSVAKP